jgi:hypothetical protein
MRDARNYADGDEAQRDFGPGVAGMATRSWPTREGAEDALRNHDGKKEQP